MRVERYALLADSGGPGRHRGGCGSEASGGWLGRPTQASVVSREHQVGALRPLGGGAGSPGRVPVTAPDGVERGSRQGQLRGGGRCRPRAAGAGSGGYGPPGERDPARLRDDVVNGYVRPSPRR